MLTEINSALVSVTALSNIIKTTNGLQNQAELLTAVNEISIQLSQALVAHQTALQENSLLNKKITELEEKINAFQNWQALIQEYQLHKFETGTFAYSLNNPEHKNQPHHYLCATCAENKIKSILQPNGRTLKCPQSKCSVSIAIKHTPKPQVNRSRGRTNW